MKRINLSDLKDELILPPTLYKIRVLQSKRDWESFLNHSLFLPAASTFNDPYDCKIPLQYKNLNHENKRQRLINLSKNNPFYRSQSRNIQYIDDFIKNEPLIDPDNVHYSTMKAYQDINQTFGIFCLASNIESTVMWSYYGDSHKGFAIGYDTYQLLSTGQFNMWGPVNYIDEMPLFEFEEPPGHFFAKELYTKSTEWEHEKEYRLLHQVNKGNRKLVFDASIVNEFVFGSSVTDAHVIEYSKKIEKSHPKIKISQMKTNLTSFGIRKELRVDLAEGLVFDQRLDV